MTNGDVGDGGSDNGGSNGDGGSGTNTMIALEDALALVYDAIALAQKGLRANPSKEEGRKLSKTLARLEVERADLEGLIDAMADAPEAVQPPTPAQVESIAALIGEVANLTRANLTATAALAVASKVLDLAIDITGG